MRRHLLCLALAATVVAGAGACDDGGGGGEERLPAGQSTTTPDGDLAGTGGPPGAPPPGGILASRDVQHNDAEVRMEITGLQRQGQILTLTWRMTVVSSEGRWSLGQSFGSAAVDFTVSGVTLVDPVNAQRYRVARGGEDGDCACTQNTAFTMAEGETAEFFATYSAPPPDVTTLNVEFPRFGAFRDVPIS